MEITMIGFKIKKEAFVQEFQRGSRFHQTPGSVHF